MPTPSLSHLLVAVVIDWLGRCLDEAANLWYSSVLILGDILIGTRNCEMEQTERKISQTDERWRSYDFR